MMFGRLVIIISWLIRPGVASAFNPKDGIVQECNTSFEVTIIRVGVIIGITKLFDVDWVRILSDLNNMDVIFFVRMLEYSYDQYHWKPIVLIVMMGLRFSSIKYKVFKEGIAININMIAGRAVQNSSVSWDSNKNRLKVFFESNDIINILNVRIVIVKINNILCSWKKVKCSIKGEFLFCK